MQFGFGDHVLDVDRRELRRGGELITLEPQVFDLLVYLVQNRDRVVSKDDLLEAVWGGRIVSDSALTSRITAVRKAVGDSGEAQRLIRTVPRKGLRFVGVVRERGVERRLAAILAADVAGYSRLMGQDEEGTLRTLQAYRAITDALIDQHGGRIVSTAGDSILAEFASPLQALRAALALQQALARANAELPDASRMQFRVGINLGDVMVDGNDLLGDGVNIAARLQEIAEPGDICISAKVHEEIAGKLDTQFADLGDRELKNIARPVRVFQVGAGVTTRETAPLLPLPDKPSIAVLPFQNISGDSDQEYFADGMVEEIITALSKIRWFFVIARNSSFTYKGRAVDVKQVSRELGVRYVLEGSVRKSGGRVRVTAQLVDAATGNHVWAERWDRELADIFAVQDEITEQVVAAIEPELYAAEHFRSRRKPPESLDAWECVIRALSLVGQGTATGAAAAEELCRRAIAIAPGYSQAHSLLAWTVIRGSSWSGDVSTVLAQATTEAKTALGLDERDPWAHLTYGVVLWRRRRHGEAERAFHRALEFNPNFALARAFRGLPLAVLGAHQEALDSAEQALRLSPKDPLVFIFAARAMVSAYFAAGNYSGCVVWARRASERHPELPFEHTLLIAAAAMQGDVEAAAEALATLLPLQPGFSLAWARTNMAFAGEVLERLLEGLRRAGLPEG